MNRGGAAAGRVQHRRNSNTPRQRFVHQCRARQAVQRLVHRGLMASAPARWSRVLLKVSGEAFAGDAGYGIDGHVVQRIAKDIVDVLADHPDVQIAIVVGGGNIWRGLVGAGAGMGRVVIFAGGTGNPFFTTDTTAALRAVEIEAGVLLKGTHSGTDGIYTDDPRTNPEATKLEEVTYLDVLNQGLRAMDSTAITLCMDNNLPIVMFDLTGEGNVRSLLEGGSVGTLVR